MSSPTVEVQSELSSSVNQHASVAQRATKYAFVESCGELALGVNGVPLARAEAAADDGSGPQQQQLASRIRSTQHEIIQPTQAACVPMRACFCKTTVFFD